MRTAKIISCLMAGFLSGHLVACATAPTTPVKPEVPYLYDGCVWRDQIREIKIDGKKYELHFRAQQCSDPYLVSTYKIKKTDLVETRLHATSRGSEKFDGVIAKFWPYDPATFKQSIADINTPSMKPEEYDQCHVVYDSGSDTYTYEPQADYMKRMLAKNEPFAACGDYGFNNDTSSYFGVIDNKLLVFFDIGQEAPLYDPDSFRVK